MATATLYAINTARLKDQYGDSDYGFDSFDQSNVNTTATVYFYGINYTISNEPPGNQDDWFFARFDKNAMPAYASINSITLHLYTDNVFTSQPFYSVDWNNGCWDNSGLFTGSGSNRGVANGPAQVAGVSGNKTITNAGGGWYTVDLTGLQSSWAIQMGSWGNDIGMGGTYRPYLVVDYVPANRAPNPPAGLSNGRGTWTWFNSAPTYTWAFSDPDGGAQGGWQLQRSSDNWATVDYDTGVQTGTGTSHTISWSNQGSQYVRVRTYDNFGVWGDWAWDGYNYDTVGPTAQYWGCGPTDNDTGHLSTNRVRNIPVGGTYRVWALNVTDTRSGVSMVRFPTRNNAQGTFVWYDGVNNGGGNWYADIPIASYSSAEGSYQTDIYAYDVAGNSPFIGSVTVTVDRTVPLAPTITLGTPLSTSIALSWTAFNDGGTSSGWAQTLVYMRKWNGSSYVDITGSPASVGNVTSYTWTGLLENTQYQAIVQYVDQAGNYGNYNSPTFTTNALPVSGLYGLTSSGYLINQRPKISVYANDAGGDNVDLHIKISKNSDMSNPIVDSWASHTSEAGNAGWAVRAAVVHGVKNYYTPQVDLGTGTFYLQIQANDGKENGPLTSPMTFIINPVNWPTIVKDTDTGISKRTVDDLRAKANAVQQARGRTVTSFSDPVITAGVTKPKKIHVDELQAAIQDIAAATDDSITWNSVITGDVTLRSGAHWNELRNWLVKL